MAVSPYIARREKIEEAINYTRRHPFSVESWDPSQVGKFIWGSMVSQQIDRDFGDEYTAVNRPIINPHAARHIHVDPSLRGDATGICMSHIGGWRNITRVGVLHAITVAAMAMTSAWSKASAGRSSQQRALAEVSRLPTEVAPRGRTGPDVGGPVHRSEVSRSGQILRQGASESRWTQPSVLGPGLA